MVIKKYISSKDELYFLCLWYFLRFIVFLRYSSYSAFLLLIQMMVAFTPKHWQHPTWQSAGSCTSEG